MITVITPASSNSLAALADVKTELGISGNGEDAYLTSLIEQASQIIASFCARGTFGAQRLRQTERLTTSPDGVILARDLNLTIVSVTEDGDSLTTDDYELDGSILYRLEGTMRVRWTAGTVVVITYDTGYSLPNSAPADLKRACIEVTKAAYYNRQRDPLLRSENVEGIGSSSWLDPRAGMEAMPPQAAALVQPYRLWHG